MPLLILGDDIEVAVVGWAHERWRASAALQIREASGGQKIPAEAAKSSMTNCKRKEEENIRKFASSWSR